MSPILGIIASGANVASGAFESIATSNPVSTNVVTFSSIPGTYPHLQIRAIVKANYTVTTDPTNVNMTFNGSSAANYAWHRLFGNGTSATAEGSSATTNIRLSRLALNNNSAQANMFAAAIIDIHDYASTTKAKTVRSFFGTEVNVGESLRGVTLHSGLWTSTAAITSISFTLAANNYASGTQFALYGIKGS